MILPAVSVRFLVNHSLLDTFSLPHPVEVNGTKAELARMANTNGTATANTAQAESEIRSLLYQERYYKDGSHWEKLRNCYHPDPAKTMVDISWSDSLVAPF